MGIFNFKRNIKRQSIMEYLPDEGFILNSKKVEWNNDRLNVRKQLNLKFKEEDRAEFFDGEVSKNTHQKRDVYQNVKSHNDLLFLNYDSENKLKELEVHYGYEIKVKDTQFDFTIDLLDLIKKFEKLEIKCTELERGNFLLPTLKITIADSESMGGDGSKLSYFYCSSDISHLVE